MTKTLAPVEAALELAQNGYYIFPCRADKQPTVKWRVQSTTDPEKIRAWWDKGEFNIGIDCDKSGLVVIDEDLPGAFAALCRANSQPIPQTYTVSTGRGFHYCFRAPTDHVIKNSASVLAPKIDVQGSGGCVIGVGSVHDTGRTYEVTEPRYEVAALPTWIVELLRKPKLRAGKPNGLADTTYRLPKFIPNHTRDDELFRYASSLRAKDVPLDEAEKKMLAAWKCCEQPPDDPDPFTAKDALEKLHNVYQQYPAGPSEPPAPEPVPTRAFTSGEGAELLDRVRDFLSRFISYPTEHALTAHTLWIAHCHLMDVWDSTPRLAFLSPEPGSGKSRALEVSELLVPMPVHAVNTTPAYLFRKVSDDAGLPTILYDEIDTVFGPKAKDNEDIRGMLNAGHRKGAVAGRCVIRGKRVETEELPAYCAVALAGLGDLPDTILSRCIVIKMKRRAPNEKVEPFRYRLHAPQGHPIRDELAAWATDTRAKITWPVMPVGIEDRNGGCPAPR